MPCQFMESHSLITRLWHIIRCRECRADRAVDAIITSGVERLKAEAAPTAGLALALETWGVSPALRPNRSRIWKPSKNPLVYSGSFAALAMMSIAGWMWYIDCDPNIVIPAAPPMPSVNANTFLTRAAHAIPRADRDHNVSGLRDLSSTSSKDRINLVNQKKSVSGSASEKDNVHIYTIAEKDALLKEYNESFALLRQGFAYPFQAPPIRSQEDLIPYCADARQLSRALLLDSQVKVEHRDYGGAVNSCLDMMELGAQVSNAGSMVAMMTGIACDSMARATIWKLIDHLDAAQSHTAIHRLEHIMSLHRPFVDVLQAEKWSTMTILKEMFQKRDWRMHCEILTSDNVMPPGAQYLIYLVLLPYSKSRILDDYSRIMNILIDEEQKPYSALRNSDGNLEQQESNDRFASCFLPYSAGARLRDVAGPETQHALLVTTLALHAYHLEHKTYPSRLETLVPRFLAKVPVDPFGFGKPLRYKNDAHKPIYIDGHNREDYILYSVGPDGKDDSGIPIQNDLNHVQKETYLFRSPELQMNLINAVQKDSKGDIVAGINITDR